MLNKKDTVCAALLRDISQGILNPGEFIPSRNQLMRRFHCSRTVVERAVADLTASGYLIGKQGKGTMICNHRNLPVKIRKIYAVSPYDAKSFRSPFTCLLLDTGDLPMPVETILLDRADAECEMLCQRDCLTVFINPGYEQLPLMNYLQSRQVPLILINREFDGFNRIYTDTIAGFREGVKHLAGTSASPLSLISNQVCLRYPYQAQRMLAFYQVCAELGLKIPPENSLIADFRDPEKEIGKAAGLFDTLPAKICVMNRDLLIPLINYADSRGLQPGREYHLLAFEYSPAAADTPGITLIRQRYDLFYKELLRFIDRGTMPGNTPFISAIPPEVIVN